jgi:hypothetical protein
MARANAAQAAVRHPAIRQGRRIFIAGLLRDAIVTTSNYVLSTALDIHATRPPDSGRFSPDSDPDQRQHLMFPSSQQRRTPRDGPQSLSPGSF